MSSRWIYRVVSFAAAMFVWLAAGQARAEAPLCDQRGATVFAPAPQLQDPELALSVGDANDCTTPDEPVSVKDSREGRPLWSAGESDHVAPVGSLMTFRALLVNVLPSDVTVSHPSEGSSRGLDRPPRRFAL